MRQGCAELAARPRPDFNPKTKESALTKRLKIYVENYVARERGLLGMWAAEDIIGDIDHTPRWAISRPSNSPHGWHWKSRPHRAKYHDLPPANRTILSWNFPLMVPWPGTGEFHEDVEVH